MSSARPPVRRRSSLAVIVVLSILLASLPGLASPVQAVSTNLVISQVYGGGGNSGATLKNDFIELFNLGTTTVNVTGWSVQYASSAGTTWAATALAGSIAPGRYYLIQEAQGAGGTVNLPTPDATGTIAMSATGGKVALVNTTTLLSGACATGASVVDFVGYDGANCSEGSPTPALTNTTAALRNGLGCTDSDNNAADFTVGTPNPRNSASAAQTCGTPLSGTGAANPDPVTAGNSTLLTVAVTPATNPASTGIAVVGDLSAIGGSASQTFFDDGSNGDATPSDNTFSFQATVPGATTPGAKSLPVTITDAQSRSANTTIGLTVQAPSSSAVVVVSQVYGGGGNTSAPFKNDFIELYNRSGAAVDITGWSVQYASSAGTSWQVTPLSGLLYPGKYYLVQEAAGNSCSGSPCGADLPTANAVGSIPMSGTAGKVALVNNASALSGGCPLGGSVVDFVGYGSANCFEGSGAAPAPSNTTADLRAGNGATDTDNNAADFSTGAPNPRNSDTAPAVSSTTPPNGASGVAVNANISITFSEPVNVTGSWFTISCGTSGSHTAAASGGPTTFTLDPNSDFANAESCTVTVLAANVSDQDTNDPPDTLAANYAFSFTTATPVPCSLPDTPIGQVEGSGDTSPVVGSTQTVQGVVVGDYEGSSSLRGFYMQDAGDSDTATSDGIFVFESDSANRVAVGDVVQVTGSVSEFQGQTQISATTGVESCGTTGNVTPVDVSLPVPSANYLERFEGMLVDFPQTLYVTEHFQLGRFGQVVMSSGDRLHQPTNVVAPGAPALAMQAANNLNRIIVDDALQTQNPDPILFGRGGNPLSASNTLRGGDTATGMVGVMSYTWAGNAASGNAYRLRPINALGGSVPNFQAANPRPASAPSVGGNLQVAGMNLLNFFNTFSGCTAGVGGAATDCRGANNQTEFDRQWPKTVAAILGIGADVIGVNEIENDGYGPTSAIQFLVDKLNAATAPGTYAFIDVDTATGQVNAMGTDAIKVGMIYKPAKVTPVGQTAALNSVAFVNGGDSAPRSRPSLAQAFQQNSNGARFIVDVNHLKSKGSACDAPDAGDGQGNCNTVRVNAANALMAWLASDPTGTNDPDILMIGDYNSYAQEDPITVIKNAGFTNLIESLVGPDAYSYVFDGQWGYLDHALGSASIVSQVTDVGDYHINSDEPAVLDYNTEFKSAGQVISLYSADQFRMSDHDSVLVGLNLNAPPEVHVVNLPYIVNEGGSIGVSAAGSDPDGGSLSYAWDLDDNGSYETPGQSVTFDASALDGPSTHTIKVQVTDNGGLTATDQAVVTVQNVAPSVSAPVVSPEPSIQGGTVSASASFSDPGPNDAPFTCTVDYGDGSGAQAGSVSGSTCTGPAHTYTTIGSYPVTVSVTDKDSGTGTNTTTHAVIYNFSGFFQPVDNLPTFNAVNAGKTIPVKFSLGGYQGLNIFAAGYPKSQVIPCEPTAPVDGIEETIGAGSSSLSYNASTDQYTYAWKTEKAWAGTCRQLVVKLSDGTFHRANFIFN